MYALHPHRRCQGGEGLDELLTPAARLDTAGYPMYSPGVAALATPVTRVRPR